MLTGGQEVIVGALGRSEFRQGRRLRAGRRAGRSAQGRHVSPGAGEPRRRAFDDRRNRGGRDPATACVAAAAADKGALAAIIESVSHLAADFPEIAELDLNPVLARPDGAVAPDVRVMLDFAPPAERYRPSQEEILRAMNRIMRPEAIAVIGASAEDGKIGNSVMKNLINGGYRGHDLSDPSQARRSAGAQGLSQRQGCGGRRSTSRCSRSRRRWWPARSRNAARKKSPARC